MNYRFAGLLLLLLLRVTIASAQINTKETNVVFLKEYGAQLQARAISNREKAFALAEKKGWPIFRRDDDGTTISLQGVSALGYPMYYITDNNTAAASSTRTDRLYTGGILGLSLSGSSDFLIGKIALWDGGAVLGSHREFSPNRIQTKDNATGSDKHATHVAGTMMATGLYAPARGMAYGLKQLLSYDYNNDIAEMASEAPNLLISNHSYGYLAGWYYNTDKTRWEFWGAANANEDVKFGYYNTQAQDLDKIAFNAPFYLQVKSAGNNRDVNGPDVGQPYYRFDKNGNMVSAGNRPAGISNNDGYDILSTTANAKNILTIGAVYPVANGSPLPSDIRIAPFSSWGPTDDGRIKPDLVADGVGLTSTSNAANDAYASMSGTSMATPNTSGTLILLQELYKQHTGNFMRASTLKGLAIATADEAGVADGPDYVYGWGLLNAEAAAKAILDEDTQSMLQEQQLNQGGSYQVKVIASGKGLLKATICWTDPEGTVAPEASALNDRTIKLVNDLDIRISDDKNNYLPWVLDPTNPSAAASTGDNIRDNVEQVVVKNALPGETYTITVSHKGVLKRGPQWYSLIVTGIGGMQYCTSKANDVSESRIERFQLNTINNTTFSPARVYSDFTDSTTDLEAGQTYALSIGTGTIGADHNKIIKVYVDWNGNGSFEEPEELVATSGVILAPGTFSSNIVVPPTVIPNTYTRLRVVMVETDKANDVKACGTYENGGTQDYRVHFVKPSNDVGVMAIISPAQDPCSTPNQVIRVRLKNYGTNSQSNIPVKATVSYGGHVTTTINGTYTSTLAPQEEAEFLLNGSFPTEIGLIYTITASTALPGDLNALNDMQTEDITVTVPSAIDPTVLNAYRCSTTNNYLLKGNADGNLFWYSKLDDVTPFAAGNAVSTTTAPLANQYYVGLNTLQARLGPIEKKVFGGGSYGGNFGPQPIVTTQVPVILESARLYIGHSGRLIFSALRENGSVASSVSLDVTKTKLLDENSTADDPNDNGAVYQLGLLLPEAGTFHISIDYKDGASIYRSNVGVTGYPFTIGGIVSCRGALSQSTGVPTELTNAWYYFYDLQVKSAGCTDNNRIAVTLTKPLITAEANVLTSSSEKDNQWYFNDKLISGATNRSYTATETGRYRVDANTADGCVVSSDDFNFVATQTAANNTDIGLDIYPIPTHSELNIVFNVANTSNIKIGVVNMLGQSIYSEVNNAYKGNYKGKVDLSLKPSGIYIVNVEIGNRSFKKKFVVNR